MTRTVDVVVTNEISCAYAAKNLAPYLQITVQPPPPEFVQRVKNAAIGEAIIQVAVAFDCAYQFLRNPASYMREMRAARQEGVVRDDLAADDEARFVSLGLHTELERQVYVAADIMGYTLADLAWESCRDNSLDGKVMTRKDFATEIHLAPERLEEHIRRSLAQGIGDIETRYWVGMAGVQRPEIVNPDFADRATEWFRDQIQARTADGTPCTLLDHVMVRKTDDGQFSLQLIRQ